MPSSTKAELLRDVAEHADTLFDLCSRLAVLEERDARREREAERQRKESDELRRELQNARHELALLTQRADSQVKRVDQIDDNLWRLIFVLLAVPMLFGVVVTVSVLLFG